MPERKSKPARPGVSGSRPIGAALLWLAFCMPGSAEPGQVTLAAPGELVETGFLKYLVPRFSLKHGIRVTFVDAGATADAALTATPGAGAIAVFSTDGATWFLQAAVEDDADLARFTDWLGSDIAHRAIEGFSGPPRFLPPAPVEQVETVVEMTGDAARGRDLSLKHCGRCHVVGEINRMKGVDNTPSFAVLRTLGDWESRFATFYVLKPHPWFTRVAELSPPFEPDSGPTIEPVTLTLQELDDILSYAAGVAPANLGAPIRHQ